MFARLLLAAFAVSTALATAEPTPLSKQELDSAAKVDAVTIPTPGELMAAIGRISKPNWQSQYRPPLPTGYPSRPQIALNVGGLIADGYIAVEAEDSQQVKNLGRDIIALAKSLAVSESVIARGNSIFDFAENNDWSALKEELEATQNEVKLALEDQQDKDLIHLVTVGGWIRGTQVVSGWILANYTPNTARLLRQPGIISFIRGKLLTLSEKTSSDPLVNEVSSKLAALETLVSFPPDSIPAMEDVKRLNELSTELVTLISKKQDEQTSRGK